MNTIVGHHPWLRAAGSLVCTCAALALLVPGTAAAQRARGSAPPKTATPPPAAGRAGSAAPAPQIGVAGIRVVSPGTGANGSELHAFNESPGTAIALSVQAPAGSGIVDIDDHGSRVDAFADDKGQSLLQEGRVGPFPKISDDKTAALVEVEVQGRPSPGAAMLSVQGTIALTLATGSKATRIANVKLEPSRTMKLGSATVTVKAAAAEDDELHLTLALPRSTLNSIREIRFFDAKGAALESRRRGSGYMNESAEVELAVKTKDALATIEFDIWQNLRSVKAPFNVSAGLGLGGTAAGPATSAAAPVASARAAGGPVPAAAVTPAASTTPTIAPAPGDGAASVDAVIKQLRAAAVAGKGRDVLAVIYPDDRTLFGQGLAVGVAMSALSHMDDQKAADKAQKDIDALFAKHKITSPLTREPAELFKDTDLAAFTTDGLLYLKSQTPKGQDPAEMLPVPAGAPGKIAISGDTATATLGGKDVSFARVNNKWFIRLK